MIGVTLVTVQLNKQRFGLWFVNLMDEYNVRTINFALYSSKLPPKKSEK